jgi:hypothetical protein
MDDAEPTTVIAWVCVWPDSGRKTPPAAPYSSIQGQDDNKQITDLQLPNDRHRFERQERKG